jgi:hypothetical protein
MAEVVEIWKDIPGFVGYQASNLGRIKALPKQCYNPRAKKLCWRKERILTNKADGTGYISLCIKGPTSKRTWLAHRLVAIAWLPNPLHKENLEWCTKSENGKHAVLNGLHTPLRGEINGNHKLTSIEVAEIRSSIGTQKEVANRYGVARTTIGAIRKGKLWAHL